MSTFVHENHYSKAYKVFIKLVRQRKSDLACLRQYIPTVLQKLQLVNDKQRFNILSIGAGDGFVDQEILKIVEEKYLNADNQLQEVEIMNTAVEPHPVFVEQYKESIESRAKRHVSSNEWSVKFDLKPMSFEEYVDSEHDTNQYDMIHAIHSLYYVDCIESALNHCYYNELKDKGMLAVLLSHHSHIMLTIVSVVNKYRSEDKKIRLRCSENVTDITNRKEWHTEMILSPHLIDVTDIFEEKSEDGNLLLDFLTCAANFRQTADQEAVKEVLKLLKDMSTRDADNGRMLVKTANELLLIYKSQ